MPKIAYVYKRFNLEHTKLISWANKIIEDYQAQGYDLTLRQVYYQMVARDIVPNTQQSYKRLGSIIDDARLAGLIDWTGIVDRTRSLRGQSHWTEPGDIISSAAESYHIDKWVGQEFRPEVWVEKDALVGVVGRVCDEWDVDYFSCRGYTSSSEMWAAAQRLKRRKQGGQKPLIIHLGDHDPSGKDMTRDIFERLELFMGLGCEVKRIALNMEQIEEYQPPPNPAKLTDSRARGYIAEFGDESWELDALEPAVITDLIEATINEHLDMDLWDERVEIEAASRAGLREAAGRWDEVTDFLGV